MSTSCPAWCTGEHGFFDQHDGPGHGTDERVCVLAEAAFGSEQAPVVNVMFGEARPGTFGFRMTPQQASDLLEILTTPELTSDAAEAIRSALTDVAA